MAKRLSILNTPAAHTCLNPNPRPQRTAVAHMESTALLILSGKYIGYLPDHFAQRWVDNGLMRAICAETYTFEDLFYLGYRGQETNRAAHRFVECAELINSN
ncbi:MAG: hypothetical protein QF352_11370 [Arenicellales bacterium]|nr:hypothetical protein [Arenicellales bacterium]